MLWVDRPETHAALGDVTDRFEARPAPPLRGTGRASVLLCLGARRVIHSVGWTGSAVGPDVQSWVSETDPYHQGENMMGQNATPGSEAPGSKTPGTEPKDSVAPIRTWGGEDAMLSAYYDDEWGRPVTSEAGLFERLTLEAFQSGLSWATILRKRENFRSAFAGFDPVVVAGFQEQDVERLMDNAGIVRNLRKIQAAITNAAATVALREEGGLPSLIWSHRPETTPLPSRVEDVPSRSPESAALAKDLKRHGFVFVGPTTAHALMEAIGMVDTHLLSSHRRGVSGLWNEDGTWAADPVFEDSAAQ